VKILFELLLAAYVGSVAAAVYAGTEPKARGKFSQDSANFLSNSGNHRFSIEPRPNAKSIQ